jgi:hypothetical protein
MSTTLEKHVVRLSELRRKPIDWLWPGRLAAGKLALLDGDPDQGKSMITLDWAARFTTARSLPDGYSPPQPTSVVLITSEDSLEDIVVPRLAAADADLSRLYLFHGQIDSPGCSLPTFPEDAPLLEEILIATRARLVIADPIAAYLGNTGAGLNSATIRPALTALAGVPERTSAAILLVRHLNKAAGRQPALYRGSGSMAIIGAVRTAFLVGRDSRNPDLRLLACTKCNYSEPSSTLGYHIRANSGNLPTVEWTGPVATAADELVLPNGVRYGETLHRAMVFLEEALSNGPRKHEELRSEALTLDISSRTLTRAKLEMKIVSEEARDGARSYWQWRLPHQKTAEEEHADFLEQLCRRAAAPESKMAP